MFIILLLIFLFYISKTASIKTVKEILKLKNNQQLINFSIKTNFFKNNFY